ncbi:MAG: hypothetical protein KC609_04760, partial [Myxococcales bacterium]|nr:hypothetical protein [Myxococcales bacterium]
LQGSTLKMDAHSFGILLVDAATGRPVGLNYTAETKVTATTSGEVESVEIPVGSAPKGISVRAYLMLDTTAMVRSELTLP